MSSRLLKAIETRMGGHRCLTRPAEAPKEAVASIEDPVDEARLRAQAIIEEAMRCASRISEEACKEGFERGYAEGLREGLEQARAVMAEAQAELLSAQEERRRVLVEAEAEIARLALRIAADVLKREVSAEPESVLYLVRDAINRTRDEERVSLRVNPVDAVVVRGNLNGLLNGSGVRQIDIEEDPAMERASCVLTTSRGDIDERIDSQLRRIAAALESVDEDGSA